MRKHWERHGREDSEQPLKAWNQEAKNAVWETPQDIKDQYSSASIIKGNRVVFNICGNKYRLIVKIDYQRSAVFTKFVGTHAEYDKIDVETI